MGIAADDGNSRSAKLSAERTTSMRMRTQVVLPEESARHRLGLWQPPMAPHPGRGTITVSSADIAGLTVVAN
jgi:hypothetical protein